jgi:hypothetical protein
LRLGVGRSEEMEAAKVGEPWDLDDVDERDFYEDAGEQW